MISRIPFKLSSTSVQCRLRFLSTDSMPKGSKWNRFMANETVFREDRLPQNADVLIVGGGLVGWSVAFWLRWSSKFSVTLVERDPTYAFSSSTRDLGSIRQQFSEPEHIQMSMFSSHFMRCATEYLRINENSSIDIGFNPQGCLMMANLEDQCTIEHNYELQDTLGAKLELLTPEQLKSRWPWTNIDDVAIGSYSYENDGWFNPWLLLKALRAKSHQLGVNYVIGDVIDFDASRHLVELRHTDMPERAAHSCRPVRSAKIQLPDHSTVSIDFGMVVNAAGPWSSHLASLAEIGNTEHLEQALPIEPRARRVFVIKPNVAASTLPFPGLDMPFLIDTSRLSVERNGLTGEFIVYSDDPELMCQNSSPSSPDESEADVAFFHKYLSPALSNRIPFFKNAKVTDAWLSICDYNTYDQNLIIGRHPFHTNMFFCSGSSGHSSQHAVAIGRAVSELIFYGHYRTIDLSRFCFERILLDKTIEESHAF